MVEDDSKPLNFLQKQFEKSEGSRLDEIARVLEKAGPSIFVPSDPGNLTGELKYLGEQYDILPTWKTILGLLPKNTPSDHQPFIRYIKEVVEMMDEIGITDTPTIFHAQKYQRMIRERIAVLSPQEFQHRLEQRLSGDELALAFRDLQQEQLQLQWINETSYAPLKDSLEEKYLPFFYGINSIRQQSPGKKSLDEAWMRMASNFDEMIGSFLKRGREAKSPNLVEMIQQRGEEDKQPCYSLIPLLLVSRDGVNGYLYFLEQTNSRRKNPLLHLSWQERQIQISGIISEYHYSRVLLSGARQEMKLHDILA